MSDVGKTMALWCGFSLLTVLEITELLVDLLVMAVCYRPRKLWDTAGRGTSSCCGNNGPHHGHNGPSRGHDGPHHGDNGPHYGHNGPHHGHKGPYHGHNGTHHGINGPHHGHKGPTVQQSRPEFTAGAYYLTMTSE